MAAVAESRRERGRHADEKTRVRIWPAVVGVDDGDDPNAAAVRAFFRDLDILGQLTRLSAAEGYTARPCRPHRPGASPEAWGRRPEPGTRTCTSPFRWGHLHVGRQIGSGSYAAVHRAYDPRLGREVAVKLVAPPHASTHARRAVREARHLMRVEHRNVVRVYGAGVRRSRPGIWMELVDGETLAGRIAARGPLDPAHAVAIGCELCCGLGAVHEAGLVHGDVKPENVMLDRGGRTVLIDFGASAALDPITPRSRRLSGTPLYLAPELLDGGSPGVASDVYAVGVLLYHAVTTGYPVVGDDVRALADAHRRGAGTPLDALRPDLPPAFRRTVDAALSARPEARPQSARALCAALRHSLDRSPSRHDAPRRE